MWILGYGLLISFGWFAGYVLWSLPREIEKTLEVLQHDLKAHVWGFFSPRKSID